MAHFQFAKSDRFLGDFGVSAFSGYNPTQAEQAYLDRLAVLLGRLAEADVSTPELKEELERVRSECAEHLLQRARRVAGERAGDSRDQMAALEVEASHRIEGIYLDRRARVLDIPFVIY